MPRLLVWSIEFFGFVTDLKKRKESTPLGVILKIF